MSTHQRGKRAGVKVAARTPVVFDEGLAAALAAFLVHAGLEMTKAQEFVAAEGADTVLRAAAMSKAADAAFDAVWAARTAAMDIVLPVIQASVFIKGHHPQMIITGAAIWDTIIVLSQRQHSDKPITPAEMAVYAKRLLIQSVHAQTVGQRSVAIGPTFSALMAQTFNLRGPDIPAPPAPEPPSGSAYGSDALQ